MIRGNSHGAAGKMIAKEVKHMSSKVYFSREITPEKVVELYHKLNIKLPGRVAVKVH